MRLSGMRLSGFDHAGSSTILQNQNIFAGDKSMDIHLPGPWGLILKYFLWSLPPFRWVEKSSCQFLKECAQVLVIF